MMKKFKFGFTLAEITTVMVVIGVITVIALASTVKKDKLNEKQTEAMTKSFYGAVDSAYNQILSYEAQNGEINESFRDQNSDNKKDGKDLRVLFNKYMDGDDTDCSKLGTGTGDYINNNVFCSEHPGNIIAGYYLNTGCKYDVSAKDFYVKGDDGKPETASRAVANSCGYIVYGIKGRLKEKLGKDFFVIPLGKVGLL